MESFQDALRRIQGQARAADWAGWDKATEGQSDKTVLVIKNDIELTRTFWDHIKKDDEIGYLGYLESQIVKVLYRYAFVMRNDGPEEAPYQVEIKCRGLGCKSREVIGRGEGKTFEEAAMLALLRANGIEVKYEG